MYLSNIRIENYRLLRNVSVHLDRRLTLLIGKNNCGKTSVLELLNQLMSGRQSLQFEDYPLESRRKLYRAIAKYWKTSDAASLDELRRDTDVTRVTMTIDYSDKQIGNAAEFIIDLDEEVKMAVIVAEYSLSSDVEDVLCRCHTRYDSMLSSMGDGVRAEDCLAHLVEDVFPGLFTLGVYAVNPSDENDRLRREPKDLQNLLCFKAIRAERGMDETDSPEMNPLGSILRSLFSNERAQAADDVKQSLDEIHRIVDSAGVKLQRNLDYEMGKIVANMTTFGYPSAEDLHPKAITDLGLVHRLENNTQLGYGSGPTGKEGSEQERWEETLPGSHNGLGYKNLIKIVLVLHGFANEVKTHGERMPLLFIEEPESHMHPQLQTTFVSFLNDYLRQEIGDDAIQVIMTSHSAHVANTVEFNQVRYMLRHVGHVTCKSMEEFPAHNLSNAEKRKRIDFVQKYLKVSLCDLYFCDKAILVEGASERLLIPDMIQKCAEAGCFANTDIQLTNQYYTIIEVGGAHAHLFFDFVDYLEIPTLIITDIDFVDGGRKKCDKGSATSSSNTTIKEWCKEKFTIKNRVSIQDIMRLDGEEDLRNSLLRRLEFQHEEYGFHPRSLEEAIINCNRLLMLRARRLTLP